MEEILETDGNKLATITSKMIECQRIQERIKTIEDPLSSTGEELISKERAEEIELFAQHQNKNDMYGKNIRMRMRLKQSHC